MKGKDITIPKGTEITAYINGDITLDSAKFPVEKDANKPLQASVGSDQQTAVKVLTNQDVIDLKAAGLGGRAPKSRMTISWLPLEVRSSFSRTIALSLWERQASPWVSGSKWPDPFYGSLLM